MLRTESLHTGQFISPPWTDLILRKSPVSLKSINPFSPFDLPDGHSHYCLCEHLHWINEVRQCFIQRYYRLMRFFFSLFFLSFITIAWAEVSSDVLNRCNSGYRSMERMKPGSSRDTLAPDPATTPRELCATLFNDNQANENDAWLGTTVAHLRIPAGELKLREFSTPEGKCRIGALIYLKKYFIDISITSKYQMTVDACKSVSSAKK